MNYEHKVQREIAGWEEKMFKPPQLFSYSVNVIILFKAPRILKLFALCRDSSLKKYLLSSSPK
ncbi:hypothetical protein LMZ02_21125 [Paenibacillus macerans]|uniref:hypothetical protein n=1 Tax=Paenibacillus macerans TaxID=44252 RepID=UPI001F10141B|nr:hypothetical protein [Paenibacillus macerans]UMV45984.1 hypothetical protein LMZ02_21125 [Paenibacillus macerans]